MKKHRDNVALVVLLVVLAVVATLAIRAEHRTPQPTTTSAQAAPVDPRTIGPAYAPPADAVNRSQEPAVWGFDRITGGVFRKARTVVGSGNYYATPGGVNTGTCSTFGTACNLARALQQGAGNTVHLTAGATFTTTDVNPSVNDALCNVTSSHTLIIGDGGPSNPSIVQAYSRTNAQWSCGGFWSFAFQTDVHFQNLIIDGNLTGAPGAVSWGDGDNKGTEQGAITAYGSTYVTFTDVTVRNCHMTCIGHWQSGAVYTLMDGIEYTRVNMSACGQVATYDQCVYANNISATFTDFTGSNTGGAFIIQVQSDHGNGSGGAAYASNIVIDRARLTGGRNGAIYVLNTTGTNVIRNSLIADNGSGMWMATGVSGWSFTNNTWDNNDQYSSSYPYHFVSVYGAHATMTNNIFSGTSTAFYKAAGGTWTGGPNLISATTTVTGGATSVGLTGTITTAPTYVSSSDRHLQSTSAARDAGTTTGAPSIDIDSNIRDAAYDLGAYEYGATGGTTTTTSTSTTTTTPASTTSTTLAAASSPAAGCTRVEAEAMTTGGTSGGASLIAVASASGTVARQWSSTGSYLEWTSAPTGGTTLSIRYKSTSATVRRLYVSSGGTLDPSATRTISLPATGGAWAIVDLSYPLAGGAYTNSLSWDFELVPAAAITIDYVDSCAEAAATTTVAATTTAPAGACIPAGRANLASIAASTGDASALTDRNESTAWTATSANPTITLTLSAPRTVTQVAIKWKTSRAPSFIAVDRLNAAGVLIGRTSRSAYRTNLTDRCMVLTVPSSPSTVTVRIVLRGVEFAGTGNHPSAYEVGVI